jgi:hypothetical protein
MADASVSAEANYNYHWMPALSVVFFCRRAL